MRALEIANERDMARDQRRRRYDIFQVLMKTRRVFLAPEHVMALNVVQLEFHDDENVIRAYKDYIKLRSRTVPENANEAFFEEADDAFFELVHAIGNNLNLSFDKADLKKFSYTPAGWQNDENQMRQVRALLIEVLSGQRYLHTTNITPPPPNPKFPPPPEASA